MMNPLKAITTHPATQQGFDQSQTVIVDVNPAMIVMVNEINYQGPIEGLNKKGCIVALCGAGAIMVPMSRDDFISEIGFAGLTGRPN